jgi:hypothetical protein
MTIATRSGKTSNSERPTSNVEVKETKSGNHDRDEDGGREGK